MQRRMFARLFHDGPIYRLERRARILHSDKDDLIRHTAAMIAIGWVPLIVLSLIDRGLTGERSTFLRDLDVHVRWLVSIPALFIGERWIDERIDEALRYLVAVGIVPAHERGRLEEAESTVERWAESRLVELALLIAAFVVTISAVSFPSPLAKVWQLAVSLPLYRFLLARFLLRWCMWSFLLLRISSLDLRLMGTHPDRTGGLGVLAQASLGIGPVGFGIAASAAAGWATQIDRGMAKPQDFATPAVAFLVIALVIAFAPLLAFGPTVRRTKLRFLREYSAFATRYAELFQRKWIAAPDADPLGTPDLQSFADLGSVFSFIDETKIVIFPKQFVAYVLTFSALPLVPIALMVMPLEQLLVRVAKMVI